MTHIPGRWRRLNIAIVLLNAAFVVHTQAQVTILPSKDNTLIFDAAGSLSSGAGQYFFVGPTASNGVRRGLLAFNLGSIPSNSTITNVTLTLNMSQGHGNAIDIKLHRVLADWGEGTSDAGNGGAGAPATTNDATWTRRFFNTISWLVPGGDFVTTASATQSVGTTTGSITWSSTPALVSDVRGWLTNPSSNFGWILVGNETTPGDAKRFDTKENATVANRPRLVVSFTTSVGGNTEKPNAFSLAQNYPNPFNPSTTIEYDIPTTSRVQLTVMNLIGQEVATLVNEVQDAGKRFVKLEGTGLPSGMYYYQLNAGGFTQTRKLVLLR